MKYNHYNFFKELMQKGSSLTNFELWYDESTNKYNSLMVLPDEANYTAVLASKTLTAIVFYYSEHSVYYMNQFALQVAKDNLERLLELTHEDGSHDLYSTNFHDPNQVGFLSNYLYCVNVLAKQTKHTKLEDELYDLFLKIFSKFANALTTLGFHTPNHRWVQTSALMLIKQYIDNPKIQETIDKYFWEGIDCDENGEYTERSTGTYNYINNEAFINMYFVTKDKKYLEYPRRNLMLMRSFIEPDNCINTMNSLRQDQGDSSISFFKYYTQYIIVATLLQDEELAYFADKIYECFLNNTGDKFYFHYVYFYLMTFDIPNLEEVMNKCPSHTNSTNNSIVLENSGVARFYLKNYPGTITLCKSHGLSAPDFFKIQIGKSCIYGRFAGAFFGYPHTQFSPKVLKLNDDGSITLSSFEEQGYRSQFKEPPETSVWRHMDHTKREWLNIQHFNVDITFKLNDDESIGLDIHSTGVDNVLTKLELSFNSDNGKVINDSCEVMANKGGYMIASGNFNFYDINNGIIYTIKSKKHEHSFAQHMRGSAPVNTNRFTVAFTNKSPVNSHIDIKINNKIKQDDLFKFD